MAAACAGIIYFLTYVPYMYVAIKEDVAGDEISAEIKSFVVGFVDRCLSFYTFSFGHCFVHSSSIYGF